MIRFSYILLSSLLILVSLMIINPVTNVDDSNIIEDAEQDSAMLNNELEDPDDMNFVEPDRNNIPARQGSGESYIHPSGAVFEHKADIKVDGVIEKDKGGEWWILD